MYIFKAKNKEKPFQVEGLGMFSCSDVREYHTFEELQVSSFDEVQILSKGNRKSLKNFNMEIKFRFMLERSISTHCGPLKGVETGLEEERLVMELFQ